MRRTRRRAVGLVVAVAAALSACGGGQDQLGTSGEVEEPDQAVTIDVPERQASSPAEAALRVCHDSHLLDRNALIDYDSNTVWELAVNMEPELATVEDPAVKAAGTAVVEELPPMFEAGGPSDAQFSRVEDLLFDLYAACGDWTYEHLYSTG